MSRYDSEHERISDSDFGETAEGVERLVERYNLEMKVAAFYAVAFGVGLLAFRLVSGSSAKAIIAIAIWFTVIFAVLTTVLGGLIKAFDAVKRSGENYE